MISQNENGEEDLKWRFKGAPLFGSDNEYKISIDDNQRGKIIIVNGPSKEAKSGRSIPFQNKNQW